MQSAHKCYAHHKQGHAVGTALQEIARIVAAYAVTGSCVNRIDKTALQT